LKRVLVPAAIFGLLIGVLQAEARFNWKRSEQPRQRAIAITFDDLMEAPPGRHSLKTIEAINRKLVSAIVDNGVPAIGFVNEQKLYRHQGKETDQRIRILEMWLQAGLDLGNHTYSHPSLFNTPIEEFKKDVIRGEKVTRRLLNEKGKELRFFRHPFLNTGPDLEIRRDFEKFLESRGYRVAPVTIDNQEWMFASVYADALEKNDQAMMKRVADAYVPYIEAMVEHYEKMSVALLGYEIRQTLLLHGNALNADHFDRLAKMMKGRGYQFIPLDEALKDEGYRQDDRYAGRAGISWLERWAITQKKKAATDLFKSEPKVPEFITERM